MGVFGCDVRPVVVARIRSSGVIRRGVGVVLCCFLMMSESLPLLLCWKAYFSFQPCATFWREEEGGEEVADVEAEDVGQIGVDVEDDGAGVENVGGFGVGGAGGVSSASGPSVAGGWTAGEKGCF